MAILPESPALSRASSDDAKAVPDTNILEKGVDAERAPSKPPVWKRIMAGDASDGNETKRAMQSRHLTMIGKHISRVWFRAAVSPSFAAIGGTIGTGIFLSAGSASHLH